MKEKLIAVVCSVCAFLPFTFNQAQTVEPPVSQVIQIQEESDRLELQSYNFEKIEDIARVETLILRGYNYLDYLYLFEPNYLAQDEIERVITVITQYEQLQAHLEDIARATIKNVPSRYNSKDFKSFEPYTAITSKTSPHYKLQHQYAYTGTYGIRMVNGRYCIALGSYFTTTIGQYIDIILENGTVIPCILGDQKSNMHTDDLHIAHPDGSVVEFIIDKKVVDATVLKSGNISNCCEEWKSPVVQVRIYDKNLWDT